MIVTGLSLLIFLMVLLVCRIIYQAGDYYLVAREGQEVTLSSTNGITRHIVFTVDGQKLPRYIE